MSRLDISLRSLVLVLLFAVVALLVATFNFFVLKSEVSGYATSKRSDLLAWESRHSLAQAGMRTILQQTDIYLQLRDSLQSQTLRQFIKHGRNEFEVLARETRAESLRSSCDKVVAELMSVEVLLNPILAEPDLATLNSGAAKIAASVQSIVSELAKLVENKGRESEVINAFYDEKISKTQRTSLILIPLALALAIFGGVVFFRLVIVPLDALGRATQLSLAQGVPFAIDGDGLACREIGYLRAGTTGLFLKLESLVAERTDRLQVALEESELRQQRLIGAENSARRSQAQFAEVFDATRSGLLIADLSGQITYANDAVLGIFKQERAQILGRPLWDVLTASKFLPINAVQPDFLKRGERADPVRLFRQGEGEDFHGELELRRFTTDFGEGLLAKIEDSTFRENALRAELRTQRMNSIGTLSGGIAHDLNNTLAPIAIGVEMLQRRYPADSVLITTIDQCTRRAALMVKQLLTFARGTPGERELVVADKIVREVADMIKGTLSGIIRLEIISSEDSCAILGDSTQLCQVLLNLCINARDAMPDGGVLKMGVRLREVSLAQAARWPDVKAGGFVECTVADTGLGMTREIQMQIFDPFFTTKGLHKGTGLGLSTSLGIIHSHRGFIEVDSVVGAGSTFRVFIPAAPSSVGEKGLGAAQG